MDETITRRHFIILGALFLFALTLSLMSYSVIKGGSIKVDGSTVALNTYTEDTIGDTTTLLFYDQLSGLIGENYANIVQHVVSAYLQQTYVQRIPKAVFIQGSQKTNGDTTTMQITYGKNGSLDVSIQKDVWGTATVNVVNDNGKPTNYSSGEIDTVLN